MTEKLTIKLEAFQAGVQACLVGDPRMMPEIYKGSHSSSTSWLRGYDAARPYRIEAQGEVDFHA
jgi:hypothetical protein